MSQVKKMLLGTAFVAMGLSASAFAQTAQPSAADAGVFHIKGASRRRRADAGVAGGVYSKSGIGGGG